MDKFLKTLKRFYIYLYKKNKYAHLSEERKQTDYQKTCYNICRKLLSRTDTKLYIAPLSSKKYIHNEELQIYIVISELNVSITNHVYNYQVELDRRSLDRILSRFDDKIEKKRMEMEKEISEQIEHSLHKVLEKIS